MFQSAQPRASGSLFVVLGGAGGCVGPLSCCLAAHGPQPNTETVFNDVTMIINDSGVPYNPSGAKWRDLLDRIRAEFCGEGFEKVDISPEIGYTDGPLWAWVRRNVVGDFISHAGRPSPAGNDRFAVVFSPQYDDSGCRVYNEFDSANRWRDVERSITATTGVAQPKILWMVMWADKVGFSGNGRHIGHPVTLSCGGCRVGGGGGGLWEPSWSFGH